MEHPTLKCIIYTKHKRNANFSLHTNRLSHFFPFFYFIWYLLLLSLAYLPNSLAVCSFVILYLFWTHFFSTPFSFPSSSSIVNAVAHFRRTHSFNCSIELTIYQSNKRMNYARITCNTNHFISVFCGVFYVCEAKDPKTKRFSFNANGNRSIKFDEIVCNENSKKIKTKQKNIVHFRTLIIYTWATNKFLFSLPSIPFASLNIQIMIGGWHKMRCN